MSMGGLKIKQLILLKKYVSNNVLNYFIDDIYLIFTTRIELFLLLPFQFCKWENISLEDKGAKHTTRKP